MPAAAPSTTPIRTFDQASALRSGDRLRSKEGEVWTVAKVDRNRSYPDVPPPAFVFTNGQREILAGWWPFRPQGFVDESFQLVPQLIGATVVQD